MNDFQVSINSDALDRTLENFQASLADNSPGLVAVADDLREMIAQQFATEGAAGGTPWAPLAPSTLRKRRGLGILNSTGALLGSLVDVGAPGHVEETDGQQLLFGSELPYAVFHQTGAGIGLGQLQLSGLTRKSKRSAGPGRGRALPMRPLIVATEDRTAKWVELFRAQFDARVPVLGTAQLSG
jgi:phage gpG-like protein